MQIKEVLDARKGYLKFKTEDNEIRERKGGTVSWRTNNPGNLKLSPRTEAAGAIGEDHIGHAVFPTREMGLAAQYDLLFSKDSPYYRLTLGDAIKRYAPFGDANNNPVAYARYITKKTNIVNDRMLKSLSEDEKYAMLETMHKFEGYKEGKEFITAKPPKTKKQEEEGSVFEQIKDGLEDVLDYVKGESSE